MKSLWTVPVVLAFFFSFFQLTSAIKEGHAAALDQTPAVEATPTPEASYLKNLKEPQNNSKALVLHKPRLSPSWGKVIQYRKEQILVLSEKNKETLHEFVLQDADGIVRIAVFHENSSGDGYWEVWVWDQP
jgi:hypothetical protein